MRRMKAGVVSTLAAALLAVGPAGQAVAQPPEQVGGAAGVIAAVVQVNRSLNDLVDLTVQNIDVTVQNVEIITIKDSLNNALQNSKILSENVITLQNFLNNCTVLSCIQLIDVLDVHDIAIQDVVAIDVLSGGDILVFTR